MRTNVYLDILNKTGPLSREINKYKINLISCNFGIMPYIAFYMLQIDYIVNCGSYIN